MKDYTLKMKTVRGAETVLLLGGADSQKEAERFASKQVSAWVDKEDILGSTFGYAFLFDGAEMVACISYNGRVWTPENYAAQFSADCWRAKMMKQHGYAGEFRNRTVSKNS